MDATAKIAAGDAEARVPRGGSKELDTLAVAFNQMAGQIAAAQMITRTHQKELESKVDERTLQLKDLAEHDPLTGLPNRRQLFSLLSGALAVSLGRRVGVFFIDLDNFKNINDGMGHEFGDRVLIGIAQRAQEAALRFGVVARLGGDEFTVIYRNAASVEEIRDAGWELVRAFQTPLLIDNRELIVSVSVGASIFPNHARTPEALLRAADAPLFRAPARCIEIELTETVLQTGPAVITALRRLRAQGIAIALDDFGTGYSSLASLEQLP